MPDLKNVISKSSPKGSSLIEYTVMCGMAISLAMTFQHGYANMLKKSIGEQNDVLNKDNKQCIITETMKEINGRIIYDNKKTYYREEK